jgi:hypothetical protein
MASSYATVDEYREDTGDTATDDARVAQKLASQSAKLRAEAGITEGMSLSEDALALCRELVTDACRKALVPQQLEGFSAPLYGASSASFSVNGIQQTVALSNPSGAAYFDRSTLAALKRLVHTGVRMGFVWPGC